MRVHRDTGYYYIGSTNLTILERHGFDVSKARRGKKLGCSIIGFIWGILLREGDPYEEFEFITLGEYETKEEASDAEIEMIQRYCSDQENRDSELMINSRKYKYTTYCPIYVHNELTGYEVRGPGKVYVSFKNKKFSLEQLKEFAEEYAKTNIVPEEYIKNKRGPTPKENPSILPKYDQNKLIGYTVAGGTNKLNMTFMNKKYSLEQLKEFAEEYAKTNIVPEEFAKTKRGPQNHRII
jgi:hypothetical protein